MMKTVLAIDPGSSKCGMALAQRTEEGEMKLIWRAISPRADVLAQIDEAEQLHPFNVVVIGSGTTSRDLVQQIREARPGLSLLVIDEKDTTLQARERYWENTPRSGWRRLLPASLQVPPEPVDDFVALILAERVLLS
jgi:RNase H-fold protein (predicted Holliday junction resolvase)